MEDQLPEAPSSTTPPPMGAPLPPFQHHPGFISGPPPGTSADERNMAMLCHLLSIFTGFVGPLVIWLARKDQSPFIDHHGKEALNFQITVFLAFLTLFGLVFVLMFVAIGFVLFPLVFVLPILSLVAEIMACLAANRGEWHRYPFCLRLF